MAFISLCKINVSKSYHHLNVRFYNTRCFINLIEKKLSHSNKIE